MQNPKDVMVWQHDPARKLAEVTVRLKNVKGALAKSAKLVADLNIEVLSGFTSVSSHSSVGLWSFFADVTDCPDPTRIRRALSELPIVESVEVYMAEDGFIVDKVHFPVMFSNRRAVIMHAEGLSGIFSHLWNVFGSGAATIVDQMAEAMGKSLAREILTDVGREFALQSLEETLSIYSALGYAQLDVKRNGGDSMIIHVRNSFECESNAKTGARRKSTFLRGHLRGFVSTIFQSEFVVTEVECVAQGDEACSFNVAPTASMTTKLPLSQEN